jgi:hypothetical protein
MNRHLSGQKQLWGINLAVTADRVGPEVGKPTPPTRASRGDESASFKVKNSGGPEVGKPTSYASVTTVCALAPTAPKASKTAGIISFAVTPQ